VLLKHCPPNALVYPSAARVLGWYLYTPRPSPSNRPPLRLQPNPMLTYSPSLSHALECPSSHPPPDRHEQHLAQAQDPQRGRWRRRPEDTDSRTNSPRPL
jgi:hypothetical protein